MKEKSLERLATSLPLKVLPDPVAAYVEG